MNIRNDTCLNRQSKTYVLCYIVLRKGHLHKHKVCAYIIGVLSLHNDIKSVYIAKVDGDYMAIQILQQS